MKVEMAAVACASVIFAELPEECGTFALPSIDWVTECSDQLDKEKLENLPEEY